MRIEGYVSKKNIKRWLENYASLEAGDVMPDAPPGNSGPKNYDGISDGRLNKIMLDEALSKLSPGYRLIIAMKWTRPIKTREACKALGVSASVYSRLCATALDLVYRGVNGPAVNYKALMRIVTGN